LAQLLDSLTDDYRARGKDTVKNLNLVASVRAEIGDRMADTFTTAAATAYVSESRKPGEPIVEFRKSWQTACKKAGLDGRLLHDLRRSAARNLIRSGVSRNVAKMVGGWKTDSMFDRYNVSSEEDLRDAIEEGLTSTPFTFRQDLGDSVTRMAESPALFRTPRLDPNRSRPLEWNHGYGCLGCSEGFALVPWRFSFCCSFSSANFFC
jgi:hypothetical protein